MSSRKGKEKSDGEEQEILPDRSMSGELRILSANTCGFDKEKWKNLQKMADSNEVDVIFMQECASAPKVEEIVGEDWEVKVTQEKPAAAGIKRKRGNDEKEYKVTPNCGVGRFYATLKRRKIAKLQVETRLYLPADSEAVHDFIFGKESESGVGPSTQGVRRSSRTKQIPAENLPNLGALGVRGPQCIEISQTGFRPVTVFNYHAPQGGGSGGINQSGMDAPKGHQILQCVARETRTPRLVIGDQNVDRSAMLDYYSDLEVVSAAYPERLVHAAGSRVLKVEQIDLGDAGEKFNNKGETGCSDHTPLGLKIFLPSDSGQ
jgi:endonuclease/exonuclease/phosphatase family metal-dependent hydrolase